MSTRVLQEGQLVKWTPVQEGPVKTVFGLILDDPDEHVALIRTPGQPVREVPSDELEEVPPDDDLAPLLSVVRQLKEQALARDDHEAAQELREIERAVVIHQDALP